MASDQLIGMVIWSLSIILLVKWKMADDVRLVLFGAVLTIGFYFVSFRFDF